MQKTRTAAEIRFRQLARGFRRSATRSGPRRLAHHSANFLWSAKSHGRVDGLRHDAQELHRRPLVAPPHGHRAAGQAESCRIFVREQHHPRAPVGSRRGVSGRGNHRDVGHVAANRDRQPDRGSRSGCGPVRQGRLRSHPLGQCAWAARWRRTNDRRVEKRCRGGGRGTSEMANRSDNR